MAAASSQKNLQPDLNPPTIPAVKLKIAEQCSICGSSPKAFESNFFYCKSCDYWFSNLVPDVENVAAPDSEYELASYEHTRSLNYNLILKELSKKFKPGATLLEIGCADGLFLKIAEERYGFDGLGIEPNVKMLNGNPFNRTILEGFFPEVIKDSGAKFDIIALNCVLEHVPNLPLFIPDLKKFLKPNGLVVINVPVASGLLFGVTKLLCNFGVTYPFDRIWQKGFVSPHLHMFSTKSISKIFAQCSMTLEKERAMPLFSLGGIYKRLSLDSRIKAFQKLYTCLGLYIYYPLSRFRPDSRAFFFRHSS